MALLSFPPNPLSGQIYPVNPPAGTNVYSWSSADQTWILLGKATGAAAGTYGDAITVPQITIDSTGRITFAQDVAIQLGTTSQIGLVQLVDNTTSNDATKALTAAQGYSLQNQIGDTSLLNPFYPNLVTAINAVNAPTGVAAGTYGNGFNVAQFTVSAQGRLTFAGNVPLALASTVSPGVIRVGTNLNITGLGVLSVPNASTTVAGAVQLVNNTTTNDATKALTASAGFNLQQQIDNITTRNNLTFAGTVNGFTGAVTSVTPEGTAVGFVIGAQLPSPSAINDEYFVVVTVAGTFTPPSSPSYVTNVGDWLVSDGSQWVLFAFNLGSVTRVNTGTGLTGGPITSTGTISLSNTGVTAGTYTLSTITVNAQGQVTSAASNTISSQKFVYLDDISSQFNGTVSSFTLRLAGAPYSPTPSTNLMLTVGGVPQIPGSAYTVSGSTLIFVGGAPPANATFLAVTVA